MRASSIPAFNFASERLKYAYVSAGLLAANCVDVSLFAVVATVNTINEARTGIRMKISRR